MSQTGFALLAQLVEQRIDNPKIAGSSPAERTIIIEIHFAWEKQVMKNESNSERHKVYHF